MGAGGVILDRRMSVPQIDRAALIVKAEAKYQQRVRAARVDLATYIELCVKDQDGRLVRLHHIHLAWIWHVEYCWSRGLHAAILAPFGSGKSSGFAVPLATWLLGRNVQSRIKFVSNADDFAKQRVQGAKAIMDSATYKEVFPDVRKGDKWTDREVFVKRSGEALDPSLHARGVLTKGIGGRADYLICDDICDQINSEEAGLRMKVKKFVNSTWMTRLDGRGARALWIATPWHQDDATHQVMHDARWCTLVQRVSQDMEHYDQEVINAGADYLEGSEATLFRAVREEA